MLVFPWVYGLPVAQGYVVARDAERQGEVTGVQGVARRVEASDRGGQLVAADRFRVQRLEVLQDRRLQIRVANTGRRNCPDRQQVVVSLVGTATICPKTPAHSAAGADASIEPGKALRLSARAEARDHRPMAHGVAQCAQLLPAPG